MREGGFTLRDLAARGWRAVALGFAALSAFIAAALMSDAAFANGGSLWDILRVILMLITTFWLAWGAIQAGIGLPRLRGKVRFLRAAPEAPSIVLMPICNEDPVAAAARIEAMELSCRAAGLRIDFAILSDTRDSGAQARERAAFARLLRPDPERLRVFYRNREDNRGRKAGNIEDFIRRSGGAYDFAIILDVDSLMEGETIRHLIARMEVEPDLGLLQTLPKVIGASSLFGRAQQFSASFHSPVFARGLARLQGRTGPFWGHNAIVRVRALAECCGLPELEGPAPFGGTILSHDYVEAALLARGGWRVEVDPGLGGSFEEGPDNIVAYARRDRRWCQGNLQHARLLAAPGLKPWSRFVFVQGIAAYLVSLLWGLFMIASLIATATEPAPDYFPEPYQLFPVFPDDLTRQIVALGIGIVGLLLLPKFAILTQAIRDGRADGFGGAVSATGSVLSEILLSSLLAPVMLMYQSRAVLQVLSGQDGGWPANMRGEGRLSLGESFAASGWITLFGIATLGITQWFAPSLAPWLLPVTLPMIAAPLLIAVTSQPVLRGLFATPEERNPSSVIVAYRALLPETPAEAPSEETTNVEPQVV